MIPEVSVIIPLYNKGPYVERAMQSVLGQTIHNLELIVVDDGSTDDGAKIVQSYNDPRIRLIQQQNAGVSVARNRGVAESRADFITFLDADDEWKPHFLETLFRLRNLFPEAGAYCTAYDIVKANGDTWKTNKTGAPFPPWEGLLPDYFLSAAMSGPSISSSSIGLGRHIFYEFGGFLTGAWYGEDNALWGRIALKYPIAFSWEVGAIYYENALNRACSKDTPVTSHPFLEYSSKAIQNGEIREDILPGLKEYIAALRISLAARNVCLGEPKLARVFLKNCDTSLFKYQKCIWIVLSYIPPQILFLFRKVKSGLIKNCQIVN